MRNLPIGMFDSGIGGLTLFSKVERYLPSETLYYLADTLHFPYGDKSQSQIIQYSLQNASFLLEKKIKLLVIACFTASAIAYESILSYTDIPVVSVVESLIEALERFTASRRVALLGTMATIESGVIEKELRERGPWSIFPLIASRLVKSIEECDHLASKALLLEYGGYFKRHNIDTVLLACTHFSHIMPLMREVWGEKIAVVDGSDSAASKVVSTIERAIVKEPHRLFSTGDPMRFQTQSERYVAVPVELAEPVLLSSI